jgi:T5SS/PEP-CTERM-associated repeat protein
MEMHRGSVRLGILASFVVCAVGVSSPSTRADVSFEFLAQWGGPVSACAEDGTTASLGIGHRLVTLDVTDPAALVMLGESEPLPEPILAVTLVGQYAYLADFWAGGLVIMDVSDPATPTQVGMLPWIGPAQGVAVAGGYAYVTLGGDGLAVVNVATPDAPFLETTYDTDGDAKRVTLADNYAYVADGPAGLLVLDITDPVDPTFAGNWASPDDAQAVFVSGTSAYLAASSNGGLIILDVTDPTDPTFVGSCSTDALALDVAVYGDFAYVANAWAGLAVVDITIPTAPSYDGQYDTPAWASGLSLLGSYAYVADEAGGLQIIDISAAPAASLAGEYRRACGEVTDVAAAPGQVFLSNGATGGGVLAMDVTDPSDPQPESSAPSYEYAWGLTYASPYVYLADGCAGLGVIDASDPMDLQRIGNAFTDCAARDVVVQGSFAYVADDHQGLLIIDVSDPYAPALRGTWQDPANPGYAQGLAVAGDHVFLAHQAPGLEVIDVTDPDDPQRMGHYVTDGFAQDVVVAGDYAYVADDWMGLLILDVSDPTDPTWMGQCTSCGSAQSVALLGSYALVAAYDQGVLLVDVSDPADPFLVTSYDTGGFARRVAVSGNLVVVAEQAGGLEILSLAGFGDYAWNKSFGGDFAEPTNWTPPGPPGPNDRAIFNLPDTYGVTLPVDSDVTNDRLLVDGGEVTLDLNGRTYTAARNTETSLVIASEGTATLSVENGLVENAGVLHVAEEDGSLGELYIVSTGRGASAVSSNYQVVVGISGGQGLVEVDGPEARLDIHGRSPTDPNDLISLELGRYAGEGTLNVLNGGTVTCPSYATVGGADGGAGNVLIDGGTVEVETLIEVGRGGPATITVQNEGHLAATGTAPEGGFAFIGGNAPGDVLVSDLGSTFTVNSQLTVGDGDEGTLTVEGLGQVSAGLIIVGNYAGSSTEGTLTVTMNGFVASAGIIRIGNDAIGHLLANNGGTVNSYAQLQVGYLDHGTVELSASGQLNTFKGTSPTGSSGIIAWQAGSIGEVTVRDPASHWQQDGALTVGWYGQGSLTLEGGGSAESLHGIVARMPEGDGSVIITGSDSLWTVLDTLSIGGLPTAPGGTGDVTVIAGGALEVGMNLHLWEQGTLDVLGGKARVGSGPLPAAVDTLAVLTGGTLSGRGEVTGDVINSAGTIAPGASAGSLTVQGGFAQDAEGTLAIELGGSTAGTEYDQLAVSGPADLGGTLEVSFLGRFRPALGDTFTILTASSVEGTFTTLDLPVWGKYPNQRTLKTIYETDRVILQVVKKTPDPAVPMPQGNPETIKTLLPDL